MNIGEEKRTIIVEPLRTPVPQRVPVERPEPAPTPRPRTPEKVPA